MSVFFHKNNLQQKVLEMMRIKQNFKVKLKFYPKVEFFYILLFLFSLQSKTNEKMFNFP